MELWESLLSEKPYVQLGDIEALWFYFVVYSCFGWLLENSYNWVLGEGFWKENFLLGPYKPMYGFVPLILLLLAGPETGLWITVLLCILVPNLVEYVSGSLLKGVFHKQYWDYSSFRYHLHGQICVPYSLCWLGLCLLFLYTLHPLVIRLHEFVIPVWQPAWISVAIWFVIDFLWTTLRSWRQAPVVME